MKASLVGVIVGCLLAAADSEYVGENLALFGRAAQSSIIYGHWKFEAHQSQPINAIDGNRNTNYWLGSCSHTNEEYAPWWRVDLLKPYIINLITVTGRMTYYQRLNGAQILVGNSLEKNGLVNPRCGYISGVGPSAFFKFNCHSMIGRYVIVIIPGRKELLTLCEVEVFGVPTNSG